MITLITLFFEFFKTGLFAVGGGLATIPFLTAMTEKYDWFTSQQLTDMIAVAESTPGPIGVNTATFAGFRAAGIPGAMVATFGLVLPSFLIVLVIAGALQKYKSNPLVQNAFSGLRPASTGLIAAAGWSVLKTALSGTEIIGAVSIPSLLLFAAIMLLSNMKKLKSLHPAAFIGIAAVVGIVVGL
ncbi:MAG: chromate transporter [Clostridia bacterium]|nr:chromate transporter [Clostridia bacterium]